MAMTQKPAFKTWNYWFCKGSPQGEESYRDCTIKINYDITTVQEFWVFFMELPKPSELNDNENKQGFTLCRAGVRPEWEDPELKEGGTWTFLLDKKSDNFWKYLLMSAIGQRFTSADIEDDEIVAISNEVHLNKSKKGKSQGPSSAIRIKVWHKRMSKKDEVMKKIKELLGPVPELRGETAWQESSMSFHRGHEDC